MFQNIKNDIMIFSCKLLKVLFVLYTALLSLSINANLPVKMNIDSLITVLDDCISQDKLIDYLKQKRIDEIKLRLKDSDINEEYAINNFLYEEYVYYKCDSALYYINRNMEQSFLDYYSLEPVTRWIHDTLCGVMPESWAVFFRQI